MSEKLTGMAEKNLFVRIGIGAVDRKKKTYEGMEQMVALYIGMDWLSADEANEVLGYAQQKLVEVA